MPEAAQTAYRSSATEIQQKIRRLVEVWRARNVFEVPIQDAIDARLNDIDKTRPAGKKPLMGGSLFGSSGSSGGLPKELESLAPLQLAASKGNLTATSNTNSANSEYDKINDLNAQMPAPPLRAARLSALLKSLATAESSVSESIKARKALVSELEKILDYNRTSLTNDETTLADLQSRKTAMDNQRRDVEDSIRRTAAATAESDGDMYKNHNSDRDISESFGSPATNREMEMDRPEYEALTPPPVEALTPPVGSPQPEPGSALEPTGPAEVGSQAEAEPDRNPDVQNLLASMSSASSSIPPRTRPSQASHAGAVGMNGFHASSSTGSGTTASKKRKIGHEGELPPGFGVEVDLDEDVAEMIRQESGGFGAGPGKS